MNWILPDTGAGLQSFLGLATFVRQHVRHFAELTAGLESIKNNKLLQWTPELIQDFESTKIAISTAPILTFPDFNKPFHIATDASNSGVGGILFQPKSDNEHITPTNIVSIVSKKLQPHQQRWPAYKKELFGVVYSLRKFHVYIWGRIDLVVITDHKPLTYIFSSNLLSPALQQWLDVILDYQFEIRHRDGILNVIPDQLSRMFSSHYNNLEVWGISSESFPLAAPIQMDQISISGAVVIDQNDQQLIPIDSNRITPISRAVKTSVLGPNQPTGLVRPK